MPAFPWPVQLPLEATFEKVSGARTGGDTLTGMPGQTVTSGGGFWKATITTELTVRGASGRLNGDRYVRSGEDRALAWRSLVAAVDEGGAVLVPLSDRWRPRDMDGRMVPRDPTAPMWLSELAGFDAPEPAAMTVSASAPIRATKITVSHPGMPPLRPGHFFGIGDRLYLISAAWQIDLRRVSETGGEMLFGAEQMEYGTDEMLYGTDGATVLGEDLQAVMFWPPLREPAPAGTPLVLGRPVCRMRPVAMPPIAMVGRMTQPTMEFVEAPPDGL